MAQKNKKTAKKKKDTKNKVILAILIILALVIAGETYLLFAKSNQLWPFEGQAMSEQKAETTKTKKANSQKVENSASDETTNSSYDNSIYNAEETVTTDESINENGIDTTKQSTETQQDMNVLYGPEE